MIAEIDSPNWCHVFQFDPEAVFKYFDNEGTKFDLVFSDGEAQTRCLVASMAMERDVPVVVLHDAEKIWYYGWNLLNIPINYSRFDFRCKKGGRKVTAVLANRNIDLIDDWVIPGHERIILSYSSPHQPVFQFIYSGDVGTLVKSSRPVLSSISISCQNAPSPLASESLSTC
ncbi:MAG: hypothetical protein PVG93_00775 [Phycisphaerales bacterium]